MSGTHEHQARVAGRAGARPAGPVDLPFPGQAHAGGWRIALVEILHLMTSLALSLFYLLPAALLVTSVSWVGVGLYLPWSQATVGWGDFTLTQIARDALGFLVLLPMLASLLARLACRVQRDRLDNVFGIVETSPPDPMADDNPWWRVWRFVFGREAWSMVFYSTVAGLHGLLAGGLVVVLVVCGGAAAIGAFFGIIYVLAQGSPADLAGSLTLIVVGPLAAVVGLRLSPNMISSEVLVHRLLLFDAPEVRMRRRLLHVQDSRLRMVDAAEAERRRIERDLHDGAQQRLLALTMTLTRARSRLSHDPDGARELIAEAQEESKEVMTELRQVARGLHPKVLTDHGLASALPVAAGRSPIPVQMDVDLDGRPSSRAEGVAYYVACEALTNIAKHAGAEQAHVAVERLPRAGRLGDLLRIAVTDDGVGGADPEAGTGLYGLWDRVDAVDGVLTVHSPSGQGTVLTADIPWEA